jgi:hypothetical protein
MLVSNVLKTLQKLPSEEIIVRIDNKKLKKPDSDRKK